MSKKKQNFDFTYEDQALLAERLKKAEKDGFYTVDNNKGDSTEKSYVGMLDSLLESRKKYKKEKYKSCVDNEPQTTNTPSVPVVKPTPPKPMLEMRITISEISNFNIVTFSDGLRTISIDLNTLANDICTIPDWIENGSISEDDVKIIAQLRLTEVLANFYPSAIIPNNIPIKGKISKLLDYDSEKFRFYSFDDNTIVGYYIPEKSLKNYNNLIKFALENGIFISLMRSLNAITSEDGFTFTCVSTERLYQMLMTSKYADSSKVMLRLIEDDAETTFDKDTEVINIYGVCSPYSLYYEINSPIYREILGDYCDDTDESDNEDFLEDEDDEDCDDEEYDDEDCDEDDEEDDDIPIPTVTKVDVSDNVPEVTDTTKPDTTSIQNQTVNVNVSNVTFNGMPINSDTIVDSNDSDEFGDLFDEENFSDDSEYDEYSNDSSPSNKIPIPKNKNDSKSDDSDDDSFIIKRR